MRRTTYFSSKQLLLFNFENKTKKNSSNCLIFKLTVTAVCLKIYNICTKSFQRIRRWSNIVQMLYKCFVLTVLQSQLCLTWQGRMHMRSVIMTLSYYVKEKEQNVYLKSKQLPLCRAKSHSSNCSHSYFIGRTVCT